MGFFEIFKRDKDRIDLNEEGVEEKETNISEITHTDKSTDLKEMISKMKLEQAYEFKDLIDKRVEELQKNYGLVGDSKQNMVSSGTSTNNYTNKTEEKMKFEEDHFDKQSQKNDLEFENSSEEINVNKKSETMYKGEIDISNNITDDDLNNESLEVANLDDEFLELEDEIKPVEKVIEEKVESKLIEDQILDQIKVIFGEENVFNETRNDLINPIFDNKEVFCIGIRNKEAFSDETFDEFRQNQWFVSRIKKLPELSNFKMINSSNVEKNLVWDKGDQVILIAYKSTNRLKYENQFSFND